MRFEHDTFDRIEVEHIRDALRQLVKASSAPRFVLDFMHVKFMSSMILGVVMGLHLELCRRNGQLCLCGLTPPIREVFLLMRLDKILTIHPTAAEALVALN